MKRGAYKKPDVIQMREKYPYRNSPQSLTFENEIKRIAAEREESIETTSEKLADFSGVGLRQIYNYRSGKCDIPSSLIPVFCKQFGSNALALSILKQCEECDVPENFDLVVLANESAQKTLHVHHKFLEAFADRKITGFERNDLKRATASAVASFQRLEEIAEASYQQKRRRTA